MGTSLRPELSSKNKYWIEKHRYYELKHFCLQYPIWKAARSSLSSLSRRPEDLAIFSSLGHISDPTAKCAEARIFYSERMKLIEDTAVDAAGDLAIYLLTGVTEGLSYDKLKAKTGVPCCKDTYYELYRRFFWLLNKARK